jgi:hypothetical protein
MSSTTIWKTEEPSAVVPFTWDVFFTNTEAACAFTSCDLYNSGSCGSGPFSYSSDITISPSSPFEISASVTSSAGYSHIICVRCNQPNAQYADLPSWTISQSAYSCSSTLTLFTPTPTATNVNLAYKSSALAQTVNPSSSFTTWDAFFGNPDTNNCPITSCTISTAGNCGLGGFDGSTNLVFNPTSPWGLKAILTNLSGYTYSICV